MYLVVHEFSGTNLALERFFSLASYMTFADMDVKPTELAPIGTLTVVRHVSRHLFKTLEAYIRCHVARVCHLCHFRGTLSSTLSPMTSAAKNLSVAPLLVLSRFTEDRLACNSTSNTAHVFGCNIHKFVIVSHRLQVLLLRLVRLHDKRFTLLAPTSPLIGVPKLLFLFFLSLILQLPVH